MARHAPVLAGRALTRPGFGDLPLWRLLAIFPEARAARGAIEAALADLGRERGAGPDAADSGDSNPGAA